MKINRKASIAGQPVPKLREFCRRYGWSLFDSDSISYFFGSDITADLRKARLIKPSTEIKRKGYYVLAAKGSRLTQALFIARIDRAKAQRLLTETLARAAAINADPHLLYWIDRIHVFGSYLTEAAKLGDIDLIVDWARRPLPEGMRSYSDWCRERARLAGKDDYDFYDYGLTEVTRRLRARNPYLSLHGPRQHKQLRHPAKCIYVRKELR